MMRLLTACSLNKRNIRPKPDNHTPVIEEEDWEAGEDDEPLTGTILSLKNGYGFIRCPEYPENVFFHYDELMNMDFEDLQPDDEVTFYTSEGREGPVAKRVEVQEISLSE